MSRSLVGVVAVVIGGSACTTGPTVKRPEPGGPWAVAFERSIGTLATAPVFTADGGVISSGQRFDRAGRYLGLLAMEVGGGRTIANVRVMLADGRAIAEDTERGVIIGRADQPPERAAVELPGPSAAFALDDDGARVAVHRGDSVVVFALPHTESTATIEFDSGQIGPEAVTFLRGGGLAYATPCTGAGCTGSGLEVRSVAGVRTRIRDGGIDALALSPDAAVIATGRDVTVLALPDGAPRGTLQLPGELASGITPGGAIAIAPGGGTVAAVTCKQLTLWSAVAGTWRVVYAGTMTHADGEGGCAYPSGVVFSTDGASLAIATNELTVLRPGAAPAPVEVAYRPAVPEGFSATDDFHPIYMPPPGTGLAAAPRVIGEWDGGASVRAVVRDADEMAGFTDLERWGNAILTRFEPMIRDDLAPETIAATAKDALPYHRAFVDSRGRRNLEYTILVRGGCEEMDRTVRWIEDGQALIEIDIESLGVPADQMKAWIAAWFDAPLNIEAPAERRIASSEFYRGGC